MIQVHFESPRGRVLALLVAACCGLAAAPASLGAQFQALDTPTMRLIYTSPLQSYLVPQVGASFERALRFHEALFDYVPRAPTLTSQGVPQDG